MPRPRFLPAVLASAFVAFALSGAAPAAPVEWKVEDGGNGHFYELVFRPGPEPAPSWTAARDAAAGMSFGGVSGHLATVTSQAEHGFINTQFPPFTLIAWVGGVQEPDPTPGTGADQGWSWITGEPWGYTAWMNGEPNDWPGTTDERYLSMWVGLPGDLNTWNDNSDFGTPRAYVVEFPVIVPEPAVALPLVLAGVALMRRVRPPGTRQG